MTLVALPLHTQLTELPTAPAMVRFWSPGGSSTAAVVSTLPRLALVPEPDLYLDQLRLVPSQRGAVRAQVKVGKPLEFSSGPGDFVLDHDDE
jgi:hypothetical protein